MTIGMDDRQPDRVKVYPILADWVGVKTLIEVDRAGTRSQAKKSRRQIVDDRQRHFSQIAL